MNLFGTDGIRGKANKSPMNPETVIRVGMAIATVLEDNIGRKKIIIGKDTRISGYLIESALTSGICSMGADVTLVGPMPTPGVAFLVRALRLDAGVVISASHNSFEDNGIKIFSKDGFKLADEIEKEIESLVYDKSFPSKTPTGGKIGKAHRLEDADGRYIEYIKSTIPKGGDLEGLKIIIDTANGAAYKIAPSLFKELGAEVIVINNHPDGENINKHCGSLYPEALKQLIKENNAYLGIAYDGDADRSIFIDEQGNVINGDLIMAVLALELKRENKLKHNTIVVTVMSNLGLEQYLKTNNINVIRTKVGDRYVIDAMRQGDFNFGGEQSGHIVLFDYNSTGDGLITSLQVAFYMRKKKILLSELIKRITLYPQKFINIVVSSKKDFKGIPEIDKVIKECKNKIGDKGRIIVRISGTEHLIRVMVECENNKVCEKTAETIAAVIDEKLGVKK